MDIFKFVGIVSVGVIATVLTRKVNNELSTVISVACSVVCVFFALDSAFDVVYSFYSISESAQIGKDAFDTVLKIVGIGYVAEFGNNVCVDANCKSLGNKVLFVAKLSIVTLVLPLIRQTLEVIKSFVL